MNSPAKAVLPLADAPVFALTSHAVSDVVAYQTDDVSGQVVSVTQQQFLADVAQLAAAFPANGHLLNLCRDRYRFIVGIAAALVSRKISLLPSTYTATVIRQVQDFAPDVFCLVDAGEDAYSASIPPDIQQFVFPAPAARAQQVLPMPGIAADQVAAFIFTSGSTGTPVPHAKTWGKLVANARACRQRLQLVPGTTIIGTVPSQHMYGLETTMLLTLHGGCALWAGHPFHPTEIQAGLLRAPAPRLLVTTPVHLRAMLNAGLDYPPVAHVLCATAPLPAELATAAEQSLKGPLTEIYGCTETGQLATRRTTLTSQWRLHEGIALEQQGGDTFASGGHVEQRVALNDILQLQDAQHFLLLGRHADLVNIAGKRSSLSYLSHQLLAIPGVRDACYFMPGSGAHESQSALPDTARLCAFVVAPGIDAKDILRQLRQRIDAVFLPRPLIMLDTLPRNATGKLPQAALEALWQGHRERIAGGRE